MRMGKGRFSDDEDELLKSKKIEAAKKRRERFMQLSAPKISKAVWQTTEPWLVWGNQEPMRPISIAALKADGSERIASLATPKRNFQLEHPEKCSRGNFVYSCGRSSVICAVNPKAMKCTSTKRIEELSKAKNIDCQEDRSNYVFGCGRSSPIWSVSEAALKANDKERTKELAQPKSLHRLYQSAREVEWLVSPAAISAKTPARVETLATPKDRKEGPFRHPQWIIPKSALTAKLSERTEKLSQSKQLTSGYLPNRNVEWRVPKSALKIEASERIQGLAAPIIRATMDHVQFDPLAFQVKASALKGRIPSRINELAQPVIRGK